MVMFEQPWVKNSPTNRRHLHLASCTNIHRSHSSSLSICIRFFFMTAHIVEFSQLPHNPAGLIGLHQTPLYTTYRHEYMCELFLALRQDYPKCWCVCMFIYMYTYIYAWLWISVVCFVYLCDRPWKFLESNWSIGMNWCEKKSCYIDSGFNQQLYGVLLTNHIFVCY